MCAPAKMPLKKENEAIVVVGIDPGLANLGLGAVLEQNRKTTHLGSKIVRTNSQTAQPERLNHIFNEVESFLQDHQPSTLAIEGQFFKSSGDTGFKVGQAVGVCLLAAYQLDIPVIEYTPKQVKQSLVGTGAASKEQVIYMVKAILNFNELKSNHVGDALALALTYLSNKRLQVLKLPMSMRP